MLRPDLLSTPNKVAPANTPLAVQEVDYAPRSADLVLDFQCQNQSQGFLNFPKIFPNFRPDFLEKDGERQNYMKRHMSTRIKKLAVLVLFSAASVTILLALPHSRHVGRTPRAKSSSSILLDNTFNAPFFATQVPPARGVLLPDGKYVLFANIDTAADHATGPIIRYNADGSFDASFSFSRVYAGVFAVAPTCTPCCAPPASPKDS
jgi:hypothetical protein